MRQNETIQMNGMKEITNVQTNKWINYTNIYMWLNRRVKWQHRTH